MASVRKVHGRTTLVAGQRNPLGPKGRFCPVCESKPGHSCGRWIATSKRYGDGTPYWKTMTTFHKER